MNAKQQTPRMRTLNSDNHIPSTKVIQRFDIDLAFLGSNHPSLAEELERLMEVGAIEGIQRNFITLVSYESVCQLIGRYRADENLVLCTE
jgi:hypothetical protein